MAKPSKVKTPTILQMEATECGAASLGMILGYYGRFVPLPELNRACGVSRDGSKASKVVQAARNFGMQAKGFSKTVDALHTLPLPLIVFWQFNHFLVVEGFGKDVVYLNDPACGHRKVSDDEFNVSYTGVVLSMTPGPEFEKGGHKPRLWPAVKARLRSNLGALVFCMIAGCLLVIPGLAMPVFASVFIDSIIVQGRVDWFRPLLAIMLVTLLLQFGLKVIETTYLRRLRSALSTRFASHFFWHLIRLPVTFYAQRFPGEIAYRSHLNPKVANILSGQLASTAIQLLTMVLYLAVMLYYDVLLTAIGVFFALINFVALRAVSSHRVEANMRLAQDSGMAAGVAIAGLQSIETLKASGLENGFFAKWAGHYAKSAVAHQELDSSSLTLGVLPALLMNMTTTLILVVGGFRVVTGAMTIGMLVAFQSLLHSFLEPVSDLVRLGGTLQELEGDLLRLDDVLANPAEAIPFIAAPAETPGAGNGQAVGHEYRLEGAIEIRNLTFGYSPLEPALITDFSLSVKPGQRVALVGGSGSGKSTVSKIVTGLYQAWSGDILFDGRPRANVPKQILYNSVAFVDQEIMLFSGSVRDNLSLWDRTIPDETLIRACRDAAIYDVVAALPGGLDGTLQEGGTNLSGGQRQRLEIARALVNNPTILVLDEATSALDAETERIIDENLRRRGCTCVVVAHRLSTIRDCDEIIVMQYGKIIERGTHESLREQGGYYANLIKEDESNKEEGDLELAASSPEM